MGGEGGRQKAQGVGGSPQLLRNKTRTEDATQTASKLGGGATQKAQGVGGDGLAHSLKKNEKKNKGWDTNTKEMGQLSSSILRTIFHLLRGRHGAGTHAHANGVNASVQQS